MEMREGRKSDISLPRPGHVTAWLLSGREQEVKLNIGRQIGADNPFRAIRREGSGRTGSILDT